MESTQPIWGEHERIPLPSMAVDVPAGESICPLSSPTSDELGSGRGSPGTVAIGEGVVHLPVLAG